MTASAIAATIDPAYERDLARKILDGRRYKGSPVPRPLHAVLRWLGDRFAPITRWIGDRFSWLPDWSRPWVVTLALAALGGFVAFTIVHVVRARTRDRAADLAHDARQSTTARADNAAALEAAAADAEARGDHALAVRLRFRAGLLRLDRDAHAISYRPSIPMGTVRSELESPEFDALADRFERITYGGADAEPADTEDARKEWPRVVAAARKR